MNASLDTNTIIHFYRAGCQNILFEYFDSIYLCDQVYLIELNNHGQDILSNVNLDIQAGNLELFSQEKMASKGILQLFKEHTKDQEILYNLGDKGEAHAIALAKTLGACCLVTDDTKIGGPYKSLLQFEDEVMPFTFAEVIILYYIFGTIDASQAISYFNKINTTSTMNWDFESQLKKFLRRFGIGKKNEYKDENAKWFDEKLNKQQVNLKNKLQDLQQFLKINNQKP